MIEYWLYINCYSLIETLDKKLYRYKYTPELSWIDYASEFREITIDTSYCFQITEDELSFIMTNYWLIRA